MKKTLTYLLRYVNVLKKTMIKNLITYVVSTYLQLFSPVPCLLNTEQLFVQYFPESGAFGILIPTVAKTF